MIATRSCASLIGAALVAGLAGSTPPNSPPNALNLLLVTLDTTRADRLSAYGFQSTSMPAIDRLAREGIVFRQAITAAPLTLPAHCSLLTGLYPVHHGVHDNADPPLDSAHVTLAETLHRGGYRTAAFVAASVLAADRGLSRGFDIYRDTTIAGASTPSPLRRPGNEVVDDALRWLSTGNDSSFFLWVHLYDAHAPYQPPEPYRTQYATDPYQGSLAFMDSQLDRVVHALEASKQLSRTVIVVAGDHGESLGDHGELEHGIFLYDSVLHVPLIMRVPGVGARPFDAVTSLVDVMPTVLGFLQIRSSPVDGQDLTAVIRGTAQQVNRTIYSESRYPERFGWSPLRSLHDGRFKFISAPRPELYDLEADPFEERNVYSAHSATATALAERLERLGGQSLRSAPRTVMPLSPDARARLAALGYVSGDARQIGSTGLDPKDYIQTYNATLSRHQTGPH
jgi:arylsulfatase A-like enzyme